MSDLVKEYERGGFKFRVVSNMDESRTITRGAWILLRKFKDGTVRRITIDDAPADMARAAEDLLKELP